MRSGPQPEVRRLAGEAVARHGGQNEIERVLRASAVRRRIGERADGIEQLEHRAGPTMRHDQRHGVRMTRAHMNEVDVHAVDRRHELRQGVELGFGLSPVVAGAPMLDERLELRELYALRLVIDRLPVGPARVRDAAAEVLERRLRHLNCERPDRAIFGRLGVIQGGKKANPECQRSRQFVEVHGRASLPGAWNVTVCPVRTLPSASTASISTLCSPRGMPTRMMVLL